MSTLTLTILTTYWISNTGKLIIYHLKYTKNEPLENFSKARYAFII